MIVSQASGPLKLFRRTQWKYQLTFQTPLKDLRRFVTTLLSAQSFESGSIIIDQVVFEPAHIIALLTHHSISPRYGHGLCLTAEEHQEIPPLLQAALSDWLDFVFVPRPKRFVMYADHDEYTTFYTQNHSNLYGLSEALLGQGFKRIRHYKSLF